jgi:DNA-binding transcriptional ArsR family regulator
MDSKSFRASERFFKELYNERRLLILSTIAKETGPVGYSVVELAEALKLPYKSLSKHLQILDQANLIERARQGQAISYTATKDGCHALTAF